MYKVLAFIARKPGISREEFRDYYERHHAPLIGDVAPPMQAYRRNFLIFGNAYNRRDSEIDFDVVTEMEFPDKAAFEAWIAIMRAPEASARVAKDEENFIDRSRLRVCAVEVSTSYS